VKLLSISASSRLSMLRVADVAFEMHAIDKENGLAMADCGNGARKATA
jgi:hypothetical protein